MESCKYSELFVQIVDVLFLQLRWFSVHPLINWLCALARLHSHTSKDTHVILYLIHKHKRRVYSGGSIINLQLMCYCGVRPDCRMSAAERGWRLCCQRWGNEWSRGKRAEPLDCCVGFCLKARPREEWEEMGRQLDSPRLMIGYKTRLIFWAVCVSIRVCLHAFFPVFHAHTSMCCPVVVLFSLIINAHE